MSAAVAQPTPEAAKAAPAHAAQDDDAPLPPLDHDAEIKDQIARAQENVARDERSKARQAKAGEKKAAATKPEPKAKAEPTESTPEEAEADKGSAADAEPSEPSAATLARARELYRKGDLDAALELALGVKPDALRINSARWADFRKAQTEAKRQDQARQQRLEAAARQLEEQYGPLVEAKRAYEAEEYEQAFRLAFGDDVNAFQRKLLGKFHGKNPEVEALKRELRERDEREARARQETAEREAQAEADRAYREEFAKLQSALTSLPDSELAELSRQTGFVQRVVQVLQQHYDPETNTSLPVAEAAGIVRDEILERFAPVFTRRTGALPESPDRAGTKPARQATSVAQPSLSQRGAQGVSEPGAPLSDGELVKKYTRLHAAKLGKAANG